MATKNDITGDSLVSKTNSKAYEDNYDKIFGKKKKTVYYAENPLDFDEERIDVIGQNGNIGYSDADIQK
jgi:hypothetical protein